MPAALRLQKCHHYAPSRRVYSSRASRMLSVNSTSDNVQRRTAAGRVGLQADHHPCQLGAQRENGRALARRLGGRVAAETTTVTTWTRPCPRELGAHTLPIRFLRYLDTLHTPRRHCQLPSRRWSRRGRGHGATAKLLLPTTSSRSTFFRSRRTLGRGRIRASLLGRARCRLVCPCRRGLRLAHIATTNRVTRIPTRPCRRLRLATRLLFPTPRHLTLRPSTQALYSL